MSETATNETTQVITEKTEVSTPEPVKRGRGRPKGSKNKPKPEGYVKPERKAKTKTAKEEVTVATVAPTAVPLAAFVPQDEVIEVSESIETGE